MTTVSINGRAVRLQADMVIGKGGEADIYKLDRSTVLKLYKQPNDPDYIGDRGAQLGAKARLDEQQHKLPTFPKNVPSEVVTPKNLVYGQAGGRIVGYTMPFVDGLDVLMKLGDRKYRETGGIDGNQVISIFRQLHDVVRRIHASGVVIGDFNDLNVLADATTLRIVDADSMQFGGFYCHTYTNRFVDPLVCDSGALTLARPHNEGSDWYAYFIMLLQSLLYAGPYAGVHRPKTGKRLQHDDRVLSRLTVLNPEVIYPKPAMALSMLPDEFVGYLQEVFEKDKREFFPLKFLDGLRFTTCMTCGSVHARKVCPSCMSPGAPVQTITIRGTVTARSVFRTNGRLLHAVRQADALCYVYHENGAFYREGGRKLFSGDLDPELRFRIQGQRTLVGKGNTLLIVNPDGTSERLTVDVYREKLPMFDANADNMFWVASGQLLKDGRLGPTYMGDILAGQTLFWVGKSLGFGFYQAGNLVRSFILRTNAQGLNDQVDITSIPGQLVDATCSFSDELTWFMMTIQEQGRLVHHCYAIDLRGTVLARVQAAQGEDSWLASGIRGHMAVGNSLYVATDEGIVRIGTNGGQIDLERTFPDTEPFVDEHAQLVLGPSGIYAVSTREIALLEIR